MSILVVDDSPSTCKIVKSFLQAAGYSDLLFAGSAQNAFEVLGIHASGQASAENCPGVDLILLDIILPDMDGREACHLIKSVASLQDVPVIMITALTGVENLEQAFASGAIDYITKPINKVEMLARIRSALKLKDEMDRRKAREHKLLEVTRQLEVAVEQLNKLSSLDGLTGVANRRRFDEYLNLEWNRGRRNAKPLSLILVDIDHFKTYNDTYGHQAGDECLKTVARTLQGVLKRPGDLLCRYGGEEFAVVLPETNRNGAVQIANSMCSEVETIRIMHETCPVSNHITISLGVATVLPTKDLSPQELISSADKALYTAKHQGRNTVSVANIEMR